MLLAYAETGKLREACRAAYVDTKLHSYWKRTDPDYAAAYDERHPLAPGWQDRVPLYQLFPLLVHATLFGGGYAASVERVAAQL